MMRVLFSDNLHFHKRNFKSLIEYAETTFDEIFYNSENTNLCSLKGNYTDCKELNTVDITRLNDLTSHEILKLEHKSINLYGICRAELLCYISTFDSFSSFSNDFTTEEEIHWIINKFRNELISNIAASIFWIDFWLYKLSNLPVIHKVIVFSGSTIYTKSLLEICKKKQADTYVAETFFTGNDFYLERKNTHISNNSDLKFDTYINSLDYTDKSIYDKERLKAHNKIRMSKNKNVTQPNVSTDQLFSSNSFLLIIGQVVNDFSILENKKGIRNTVLFYRQLIESFLVNTSDNIVFKSHPWERHNINLRRPKTLLYLEEWRSKLPEEYQSRFIITEDYNLLQLLSQSSAFFTICSQAALEAAYHGFKPVQFGNAFYGNKGFTFDYSYDELDQVVESYKTGALSRKLTLSEYSKYERFMTIALQKHLVSVHKSGHVLLRSIFAQYSSIKLSPVKSISMTIGGVHHRSDDTISDKAPSKRSEDLTLFRRRLRKLKNTPKLYFKDSKHKPLRLLAVFFKD